MYITFLGHHLSHLVCILSHHACIPTHLQYSPVFKFLCPQYHLAALRTVTLLCLPCDCVTSSTGRARLREHFCNINSGTNV